MKAKSPRTQHYPNNGALAKNARKTALKTPSGKVAAHNRKTAKKRRVKRLPVCMTVDEVGRFFKAIEPPRDRAIFALLYYHGLRASEPGLMQYSDYRAGSSVGLDRMVIKRQKGSVSCESAVVPAAATAVRAWIRLRGTKQGPLFPSRNHKPISRSRIYRMTQHYAEVADIPKEKQHPHVLKHSAAVHLLSDRREGLVDVQRHLGHRDIKSTMVYLQALDSGFNDERIRRLANWR